MRDFETVQQELIELAKKYDVKQLWIFGSRAKGRARPKSDIDLCVDGCEDFTGFFLECIEDVNTLLEMDIVNLPTASFAMHNEITKGGILVYEKQD